MITWIIGENSFEAHEALKAIEANFSGVAEKVDATQLTLAGLPDLLMGVSLFSTERLVVLRDITANASLWEKLPDWLERINDTIHLVFVDQKPDKRTTSYKALKAVADVKEYAAWTERDTARAEQWVSARAQKQGIAMNSQAVKHIVARIGVDQWRLSNALDTVSLLDTISVQSIDEVIPANPTENIFQLFETALQGAPKECAQRLAQLQLQEDPYALFALLSSQALTLAAMTYAGEADNPAKEFAIHPFVASKMSRHAQRLGKHKVGAILELFAQTDADMKRSKAAPWVLIERLLLKVAETTN